MVNRDREGGATDRAIRGPLGGPDGKGRMKHHVTRALHDYWDRLRGPRLAPDRGEIEPADIRGILGDTFILEVVEENDTPDFRFRLAGTRVCALYGRELKGRSFLPLWSPKRDRDTVRTLLEAVATDAAAAVVGIDAQTDHERVLACEVLLLPIRQGQGYTRILGSLAPMETPYWIGIHPVMRQSVTSLRMIWPDERRHLAGRAVGDDVVALSERPVFAPASAAAEASRRVRHLVVYDGGKS